MSDVQFDTDGMPFEDEDAPAADTAHGAPAGGNGASAPAPADAEAAMVELERHQDDDAFMQRYLNGDKAAGAEMRRLYAQAFPEPGAVPAADPDPLLGREISAANDPAADANNQMLHEAALAAYQPPAGPWAYPVLFGPNQTAAQTAGEMAMKQAFFDSGVPVPVVNVLRELGLRNAERGIHGDAAKLAALIPRGTAELERRHGANAGQIIADARAAFERLDAASADIGDALIASGLASTPEAIECLARWHRASAGRGEA